VGVHPVMAAARHFPSPSPSPSPSSSPWLSLVCRLVVVGERGTNKEVGLGSESPTKDRRVRFAVDMPTAEPTRRQGRRAPIKTVDGRAWSPVLA
jgi:hypothetical protein